MSKKRIDGKDLSKMFFAGAESLSNHASAVDALNVFPVPDGDTGTNMNLSMSSGVLELKKTPNNHAGKVSQAVSKGLLMGARGNSGVILSQLFRGFSRAIAEDESVTAKKLASAFSKGVAMAYDAVMKPVEGTILTVAKDAADAAEKTALRTDDALVVMKAALDGAKESLARTPELLPVLKEVGVVDSGGQGLVYIYSGFYRSLLGEEVEAIEQEDSAFSLKEELTTSSFQEERAFIHMQTEEIERGYCAEFLIRRNEESEFQLAPFREQISQLGDSLLVVADDEWVKVHIHSEYPGKALDFGQQYGELVGIKIENMREQHAEFVSENSSHAAPAVNGAAEKRVPYGIVAAAVGEGMADIFKSLGVHQVIEGGQTMNPSTEDFVLAAKQISADHIIFLPNNKNIIMAAEQAASLIDSPATVIPSRSMPQGMAALLALKAEESADANKAQMIDAISEVKTGQITYAVRDTQFEQREINVGDFIGLFENEIVATGTTEEEVALQLLSEMIDEETELVSVFYGKELDEQRAEALVENILSDRPDVEIELYNGGQPVYSYIFSVE